MVNSEDVIYDDSKESKIYEKDEWKLEYKALVDKNLRLKKRINNLKSKLIFLYFVPKVLKKQFDDFNYLNETVENIKEVYMSLLSIDVKLCKEITILKSIDTSGNKELTYHKDLMMSEYSRQKKLLDYQLVKTIDNLNRINNIFRLINKNQKEIEIKEEN